MRRRDIKKHLKPFREDGAVRLTPRESYESRGNLGPPSGTYVFPKGEFNDIRARTGGDLGKIEKELGLDSGSLTSGDTMIAHIPPDQLRKLRMPSGNEMGANSNWIPGGYTSGAGLRQRSTPPKTSNSES